MSATHFQSQAIPNGARRPYQDVLDYRLLAAALFLLVLGLVMVTSASLSIAESKLHSPFFFVYRHTFAIGLGLTGALLAFATPMKWWERSGTFLFFFGIFLLILVLVPGIGKTANGATRWINLGAFSLQSSEYMKLFAVAYIAGYLVRRSDEVSSRITGFIKPLLLMGGYACWLAQMSRAGCGWRLRLPRRRWRVNWRMPPARRTTTVCAILRWQR